MLTIFICDGHNAYLNHLVPVVSSRMICTGERTCYIILALYSYCPCTKTLWGNLMLKKVLKWNEVFSFLNTCPSLILHMLLEIESVYHN